MTESRLQNFYIAALTPYVTVFGDGADRETNKVTEVIRMGPRFNRINVFVRRGSRDPPPAMRSHRGRQPSASENLTELTVHSDLGLAVP